MGAPSGSRSVGGAFGIRAFGSTIAVVADCEQALTSLERFLMQSLQCAGPDLSSAEIVIRVQRNGNGFQLFCGDAVSWAGDARALVVEAVRLLDDAIVRRLTSLTAVHAGVVEFTGTGRALLLPGGTHAGKSALVAELLRHGAVYFSDEYALIDSHGNAHPYPRPLLLRSGGPEQVPTLPGEWGARVGLAPVPVGWILALEYDPAAPWRITAVPQSEAFLILLRNTPHALAETPRMLDALRRASAGAECYAGRRNDAADAAERILRLVAG